MREQPPYLPIGATGSSHSASAVAVSSFPSPVKSGREEDEETDEEEMEPVAGGGGGLDWAHPPLILPIGARVLSAASACIFPFPFLLVAVVGVLLFLLSAEDAPSPSDDNEASRTCVCSLPSCSGLDLVDMVRVWIHDNVVGVDVDVDAPSFLRRGRR